MAELRALLAAPDAQRVYAALGEAGWAARCAERDAQRDAARGGRPSTGSRRWTSGRCRPWTSAAPTPWSRFPSLCGTVSAGGGSRRGWGHSFHRRGAPPGGPNRDPAAAPPRAAPADLGHSPRRDRAGAGKEAGPPRRLRPDPRRAGPRARPGGHLEAGAHRAHDGRGARRRPTAARPARRPRAVRAHQGRHVPVPRLPTAGLRLRSGPRCPVPAWTDKRREPARAVPPASSAQARDSVAGQRPTGQPAGVGPPPWAAYATDPPGPGDESWTRPRSAADEWGPDQPRTLDDDLRDWLDHDRSEVLDEDLLGWLEALDTPTYPAAHGRQT